MSTTSLNTIKTKLGLEKVSEIPRLRNSTVQEFNKQYGLSGTPVILENMLTNWRALNMWTLKFFKENYPDIISDALVNEPEVGSIGHLKVEDYVQPVPLAQLMTLIEQPGSKYRMGDIPIQRFPGIDKYIEFKNFLPRDDTSTIINLWFGGPGTKSNLHWDPYDNFLAQIYGRKLVLLYSPEEARNLYPFNGYVRVSPIDPFNPSFSTYPRYRQSKVMMAILRPGDLLFFGKGWWHQIKNEETTIGVNCFFGNMATTCYLKAATRSGFKQWAKILQDFFYLGVLGKEDFDRFVRIDQPTGRHFYKLMTGVMKRQSARLKKVFPALF